MDISKIKKIEKCCKEEECVQKPMAFLRKDLVRKVFKVSFGIKFYYYDESVEEEYYDYIYRENLQDGFTYYPNESCNSFEEIINIAHCATERDRVFEEIESSINK